MSLINEALKKAQNQRTVELTAVPSPASASAATGAQPQVRIAKRPPPLSARTLIGLIAGGVFGLLAIGVVSFFYFSAPVTPPPAAVVAKPSASTPGPVPVATAPTAAASPGSVGAQAPLSSPVVPAVTPQQMVTVSLPPIPGAALTGVAPAAFDPPARHSPPPVPTAPVANPKISDLVDTLRISVVRLTPTDPKVVLNGQVYRINDMVDRGLKVRLIKIESSTLVFSDANGFEYPKNY